MVSCRPKLNESSQRTVIPIKLRQFLFPFQSPRHILHLVPEPTQVYQIPHLYPLQMAHYQDYPGPSTSHHGGPFPLLHAWLYGQEASGSMRQLPYSPISKLIVRNNLSFLFGGFHMYFWTFWERDFGSRKSQNQNCFIVAL